MVNRTNVIDLDQSEKVEVTAAHEAWVSVKRTFDMWVTIGRGVQRLRAKADAMGGRNTFQKLMEQNGLGELCSRKFKAITTRLLHIMDNLDPVYAWHNKLDDYHRVAWASPSSVYRHCPVFTKDKKAQPQQFRRPPKIHIEQAIDTIVDYCRDLAEDERRMLAKRIFGPTLADTEAAADTTGRKRKTGASE